MAKLKAINFKRTDRLTSLLTQIIKEYHAENTGKIQKKEIRNMRKQLLVAIETGAKKIKVASVVRATLNE